MPEDSRTNIWVRSEVISDVGIVDDRSNLVLEFRNTKGSYFVFDSNLSFDEKLLARIIGNTLSKHHTSFLVTKVSIGRTST